MYVWAECVNIFWKHLVFAVKRWKTSWQSLSGWKILPFPRTAIPPWRESNLSLWFMPQLMTSSYPLIPYSTVFPPLLLLFPEPQIIYLTAPNAPASFSSLFPFLAISWPALPSAVFIFTGVMSLERRPLEKVTGNSRQPCLLLLGLFSLSGLREKLPGGWELSDRMTRGIVFWRESETATVAVALSATDINTGGCREVETLTSHVYVDLTEDPL